MALLETVGRVVLIYAVLMVMLRVSGRRELGEMSPMEMLTLLLLSETVSPALTAGRDDLATALTAATTLVVLSIAITYLVFRHRRIESALQGDRLELIRNGRVIESTIRRERVTHADLETALHQQGLQAVSQVKRAWIEPNGEVTIIKAEGEER